MAYTAEQKIEAKKMFIAGGKIPEIEERLGIPRRTLYDWQKKEMWEEAELAESTAFVANKRLQFLINNPGEGGKQYFQHVKMLMNMVERFKNLEIKEKVSLEKVRCGGGSGGSSDGKKTRGKAKANDFSHLSEEEIIAFVKDGLFDYQLDMWEHRDERNRNILKSRQIGFTFYFGKEAFGDALLEGRNKIFLSASRAQSDIFREYIKEFAWERWQIEVKGKDKIELITRKGKCTLYFLSTNSHTAQGYHGDVYIDEYFWIPKFKRLKAVATAIASQKKWRKTYFSTPSSKSHEAYPFWSGDEFLERYKKQNKPLPEWPSMAELHKGVRCPDGVYRRIITIETAEKEGCNLFNREQLELEYSPEEFQQLFMCIFIDDTLGVFRFSDLEKCISDRTRWKDLDWDDEEWTFRFYDEVWIGYDPSRTRDDACIVVISPPSRPGGKFRVLEKITLKDCDWDYQADQIKKLCGRYNVTYIAIDKTGPGSGVYEKVKKFREDAVGLHYSIELKTEMVLKAQKIIRSGRLLWDAAWSDIAAGFMSIKRVSTKGGHITYIAERSAANGHADSAWAIMHCLIKEKLTDDSTERLEDDGCEVYVA